PGSAKPPFLLSSRLSRSAPESHRILRSGPGADESGHRTVSARGLYRRWGLLTPPRRKRRGEDTGAARVRSKTRAGGASRAPPAPTGELSGFRRTLTPGDEPS